MKLKRSAVPGNVPNNIQLELGELALNTYDGKLYTKKSVSGTETVIEIGSGGSSGSVFTRHSFSATASQTVFVCPLALTEIHVFLNGLLLNPTEDYTFSGSDLTLVTGAQLNDEIEVFDFSGVVLSDITSTYVKSNFTATAGQTSFAANYTAGAIDVWLNGVKLLGGSDYTATNGTTITFTSSLALNDVVETIAWNASGVSIFDLPDLIGVTISSESNGDILQYNSTSSKWENTNKISELSAAIEDAEVLALAGL